MANNDYIRTRRPKVLLLADLLWCSIAGTEQHISFLLHQLPKVGVEVHFALLRDTGYYNAEAYTSDPFYLHFHSFRSGFQINRTVRKLVNFLNDNNINVIYTFFPDSEIIGALAAKFSQGCTVVAARRNSGYLHSKFSLWRTRITNRLIPHFIANCQAVKRDIGKLEWITPEKFTVIRNPYNTERIAQGIQLYLSREQLGVGESDKLIGIVATTSPVKDHETFLRAARIVVDKVKETKFVLVGRIQEDRRRVLVNLITDLGLSEAIIFAGEYDNPVPVIKLFDIGVLCSRSEGLSNSLIEYAAMGTPIVATNVGGNSEVVLHGRNGFLVDPGSPKALATEIIRILENKKIAKKFSEHSRIHARQNFSQHAVLNSYKHYFENISNPLAKCGEEKLSSHKK
ncbi:MAG: glycosyltransferase [Desulfobacteraceae bacterium]|nr:glycosyltransferase [Desulfobacteraceae bacterium]